MRHQRVPRSPLPDSLKDGPTMRASRSSTTLSALAIAVAAGLTGAATADARPQPAAPSAPVYAQTQPAGVRFIEDLAERRFTAARARLAPGVQFKGFTPSAGFLDLSGRDAVMKLMGEWYGAADALERLESGRVGERRWIDYRVRWSTPADGSMVFAQHAFYDLDGQGRISRMHLVCSGDQPA
jgi:hypothetical protein